MTDETPEEDRCADCGTTEKITYGPCPYTEDVYNQTVLVWLCPHCHGERCMDV